MILKLNNRFYLKYFFLITVLFSLNNATSVNYIRSGSDIQCDGEKAEIENPRYGHTVTILYKDHIYTGVVHNAYNVITVGHPFANIDIRKLYVRVGSTFSNRGGQLIAVREIVLHPYYKNETYTYDIAFLRLAVKIDLNNYPVRSIIYYDGDIDKPDSGENVFTTGWGLSKKDGILRTANINIIDNSICQEKYNYSGNTLCAGYQLNQKATYVDSVGGPLVCQHDHYNHLCGIKVHASKRLPGIYVRINNPKIFQWICNGGHIDVENDY